MRREADPAVVGEPARRLLTVTNRHYAILRRLVQLRAAPGPLTANEEPASCPIPM